MDFKRCPDCSGILKTGVEHRCRDFQVTTARICPACGAEFAGEVHLDCSGAATVAMRPEEETPSEVRARLDDPTHRIRQYVLVELLGRGGMGEVWKTWDTKLTRWVAIKFLSIREPEGIKRFQREAKLAARLRHPNIAPVYEVDEHEGRHFIAMEFVDGTTLERAKLPPRLAAEIMAKVARALATAHASGVIHRDLKPSNIMITREFWPYILDFGLARSIQVDSSISVTGEIMGTPGYMSPEQARGRPSEVDPRSDVYSLGATLYTLLTNEMPYAGETPMDIILQVVQGNLRTPRDRNAKVPIALEAIVLKAMARQKQDRYASAAEVAADLERYLADEEVTAQRPSTARKVARRVRNHAWTVGALSVATAAVAVAGWMVWEPGSPLRVSLPPHEGASRRSFETERDALAYRDFRGGDAELPHRLRRTLRELSPHDRKEAFAWFRDQLDLAQNDAANWSEKPREQWLHLRPSAERLVSWCRTVQSALEGLEANLSAEAAKIGASVAPIVGYSGEFTLTIHVHPFPSGQLVRKNGSPTLFDLPARLELEIDDYEVRLAEGDRVKTVRLLREELEPGKTYRILGTMEGEKPLRLLE